MREVVLDTETTGLKPEDGHRIVEIGCVELRNHVATGEHRQWYINPERDMPEEARAIHGLSSAFLADKPTFGEIAGELLDFLRDSPLIIHNASFDLKFLNAEFKRLGLPPLARSRAIDTVEVARRRFPGSPANLDALCKRFAIDNSNRTNHGALLDSQLLAEVYLELCGGRQVGLVFDATRDSGGTGVAPVSETSRPRRPSRPHGPSPEELEAHTNMVTQLKSALWLR